MIAVVRDSEYVFTFVVDFESLQVLNYLACASYELSTNVLSRLLAEALSDKAKELKGKGFYYG